MSTIDRRQFLERMLVLGGTALATAAFMALLSCSKEPSPDPPTDNVTPPPPPPDNAAYLAVARGEGPTTLVERAVNALGGIGRFVKPGNDVIIKPNICVSRCTPEYAATTNPEVVAALVGLCLGAGAARVRVMDNPFEGTPEEGYETSGIAEAVRAAGGEMEVMTKMKFQDTPIPNGQSITSCRVYKDVLQTDVLIDVPVAKHHSNPDAALTLGMKNLLGVVYSPDRGGFHTDMAEKVTDLNCLVRPHLIVVDAIRIVTANGPVGHIKDVKPMNTIIASHDIVAADSYAATLFGKTARDVPIVYAGALRGLGIMDLDPGKIKIEEIAV